jgi:hypothetical protein
MDLLWMIVLGASCEASALAVWIARDAFAEAQRPPFKWDDLRKRKV